jgi:hypothetical protein
VDTPFIEVKNEAIDKIKRIIEEEVKQNVKDYFKDIKQLQLASFIPRNFLNKAMGIAVQKAVFQLKPYVDEEDYQYGVEACRTHIESIKKILSGEPIEGAALAGDERRKGIILDIIRGSPGGVTRKMLVNMLVKERRNGWDGGVNKLDEVLRDLEREDRIVKKEIPTGSRGRREYAFYLKQPTVEEEEETSTSSI